jgi:hypothetical protein
VPGPPLIGMMNESRCAFQATGEALHACLLGAYPDDLLHAGAAQRHPEVAEAGAVGPGSGQLGTPFSRMQLANFTGVPWSGRCPVPLMPASSLWAAERRDSQLHWAFSPSNV